MSALVPENDPPVAELQARLRPLGDDGWPGEPERTIVIVPSLNVGGEVMVRHQRTLPALEQRFLYLLFLLARPGMRAVLVTSDEVAEPVLDYALSLVPEPGRASARERLEAIAIGDPAPRGLAEKLLERPDLVARVREAAGDPGQAFIAPFSVRRPERDLAVELGLPLYCADSRFLAYGTKVGSRRVFAEAGVHHPRGREEIGSAEEVAAAICELRAQPGAASAVVVKQNDAVYGEGNAVLDLSVLPPAGDPAERAGVAALVAGLGDAYLAGLAADPGIVEEMVDGVISSPSAQPRTIAGGEAGIRSVHEQVLGGELGQTFSGSRFPANPAYGPLIAAEAEKVRALLAAQGVVGRFGVDFVVGEGADGYEASAIEVNLREGGTTHPFGSLYLLTGARYDMDDGRARTPEGVEKAYVSSDDLESEALVGCPPQRLVEAVAAKGAGWDPATGTGAVLHMLAALEHEGRFGVTAIGDGPDHAEEVYAHVEEVARGV